MLDLHDVAQTALAASLVGVLGYIAHYVRVIATLPQRLDMFETEVKRDISEIKAELRRIASGVTA